MSLKGKLRLFRPKTDLARYVEHDLAKNLREIETEIAKAEANALAQATALNYALSSSSGTFSDNTTAYVDVTNLSVEITTTGRPVVIQVIDDGSGSASALQSVSGAAAEYRILRGSSVIARSSFGVTGAASAYPVSTVRTTDFPEAGTYTYKIQIKSHTAAASLLRGKLLVMEM